MKNNKKKGFTLVELLVVIAILAILATVSILGYTSFTAKAKQSNAEQELAQIKTMFLADWLDGFVGQSTGESPVSIVKGDKGYKVPKTVTAAILNAELDSSAADFKDNIYFKFEAATGTEADTHIIITEVVYVQGNGYTATWNIKDDKFTTAQTEANLTTAYPSTTYLH